MSGLRTLLWPRSVAVIGASSDPSSLSGRPLRMLLNLGYDGRLYPVNPRHAEVNGLRAYSTVGDLPGRVDVALVLVPANQVLDVLEQCAAAGIGCAVVFSSGFAEQGGDGGEREQRIRALAATSGLRVLGPNAEGFLNVAGKVAATFSPAVEMNAEGESIGWDGVAVLSQSGGLGFAVFDRGRAAGVGFSYVVSTGNEVDVDVLDLVDDFLQDERTTVIVMVIEGVDDPQRLMTVARNAQALGKTVIAAKLGASAAGGEAALWHTAHSVGSDAAYQTIFDASDVVRARDEDELIDLAMLLARTGPAAGNRVGIVTLSGGAGVWLADACEARGLTVPALPDHVQRELRQLMPAYGSPRNPVDLTAQAFHGGGVAAAVEILQNSGLVDSIAVILSMANPATLLREREQLAGLLTDTAKPVVTYSYTRPNESSLRVLAELGLAWFPTPTRAANALALLARRVRVPADGERPNVSGVDGIVRQTARGLAEAEAPVSERQERWLT